jgi:Peptidase family M28
MRRAVLALALWASLLGCTAPADLPAPAPPPTVSSTEPNSAATPAAASTPVPTAKPSPTRPPRPARFDARRVQRDIEHLAVGIGPREATSRSYARAADWVQHRFEALGYRVRRTKVTVPGGNSWGTPVRRGTSVNMIAERPGFDRQARHVVIGAHLDTVPVAPGAEDNASGVAVLLELARVAAAQPPAVSVQFVAFAAEEPRGPGDALHHFGSRQLVAALPGTERRAIAAMVSLDRVGVRAGYVPVCRGGDHGTRLRAAVRAVGGETGIVTRACENRASDHWSYEQAGIPAVRIGSVPYAGYHS